MSRLPSLPEVLGELKEQIDELEKKLGRLRKGIFVVMGMAIIIFAILVFLIAWKR